MAYPIDPTGTLASFASALAVTAVTPQNERLRHGRRQSEAYLRAIHKPKVYWSWMYGAGYVSQEYRHHRRGGGRHRGLPPLLLGDPLRRPDLNPIKPSFLPFSRIRIRSSETGVGRTLVALVLSKSEEHAKCALGDVPSETNDPAPTGPGPKGQGFTVHH